MAHLEKGDERKENLIKLYTKNNDIERSVVEDLIEMKDNADTKDSYMNEITRVDQMKINSMEIIISFQLSVHVPISNINGFVIGTEQSSKGYPFLGYLVEHLKYSPE